VTPERQAACGFCDGTGLWVDAELGPSGTDPCPLCDGSGRVAVDAVPEAPPLPAAPPFARAVALLAELSPEERQRLYELLYIRFDCRIYR